MFTHRGLSPHQFTPMSGAHKVTGADGGRARSVYIWLSGGCVFATRPCNVGGTYAHLRQQTVRQSPHDGTSEWFALQARSPGDGVDWSGAHSPLAAIHCDDPPSTIAPQSYQPKALTYQFVGGWTWPFGLTIRPTTRPHCRDLAKREVIERD